MNQYAVAATLIKDNKNGTTNIRTSIMTITADSEMEAVGTFVFKVYEYFPEHHIHCRPVIEEIKEPKMTNDKLSKAAGGSDEQE